MILTGGFVIVGNKGIHSTGCLYEFHRDSITSFRTNNQ